MIFVTVGTHEQQFNRLVQCIDELKIKSDIKEDVIIQNGYSTYEPKACECSDFFPYKEMISLVEKARIVITHGGPSSFVMALQVGKVPIVVPRRKEFDEHVNDHQLDFCKAVAESQGNILVVDDIEKLSETIVRYDDIVAAMPAEMKSNNAKFCEELEKIVNSLWGGG
ncbi:MAG: multidrug MFS transporter [Oscillospiraceae bacterium]|nr:multidrug MFS transporter [Oscillospiraceae bacterium]